MTIEQAIKLAREKGEYKNFNKKYPEDFDNLTDRDDAWILIDYHFWQALGKAMGWEGYMQEGDDREYLYYANGTIFGWKAVWHRFIDHLASGKDIESFFETL